MEVIAGKTGFDKETLKEHHLSKWYHLFAESELKVKDRKVYTSKIKFCPVCLWEDIIPHFKSLISIIQEKKKITKTEVSKRTKITSQTINKYTELELMVENAIKTQ